MKQNRVPRIGMRVIKTAVAVVLSYLVFVPFGLLYREELGGVLGQAGPLYACIASIICLQSTVDQSVQLGISRLIGIGVGGVLGIATLLLGPALDNPWIKAPVLGLVCVAGLWLCLLLKRPGACVMACILPCVILITGVTGVTRYHYAVARIVETLVGLFIALGVNAVLPDLRPEPGKGAPDLRVEVKNSTKKLCVIGDPVGHSKSPLIQNTMIAALGLDYVYLCQPVPRGSCRQWLDCARFAGYAGFNATMPHKEELVGLMDELDEDARLFGAVNTVCLRDGKAWGYNTDGAGFLRTLDDEGISPAGKRVLVLGAGGAAKAVCLKLAQAGAVSSYKSQYYTMYALNRDLFDTTILDIVQEESEEADLQAQRDEAYRQHVLDSFFQDGRLKTIPAQRKKKRIVLQALVEQFEPKHIYPEPEVNAILARYHDDVCTLRRDLVGEGLLERDAQGYWRTQDSE